MLNQNNAQIFYLFFNGDEQNNIIVNKKSGGKFPPLFKKVCNN